MDPKFLMRIGLSLTPIPAIPKRRLRALDRNFRGSNFSFVGRLQGLPIFGRLPGFFGVSIFLLLMRFFLFISPKFLCYSCFFSSNRRPQMDTKFLMRLGL